MDERAKIRVTLPRENPTPSYWQDPPDDIADQRTTKDLPSHVDIVIIGSGITGAAIAWNLLKDVRPGEKGSRNIVMLEARQACSGATGRNGGHTKAASYRSFLEHASLLGTPAAVQIARLEYDNIQAIHAFAKEHNIPCDSNPCHTIDIIYDQAQWTAAHEAVTAMKAAFPEGDPVAEYTFHSPAEVQSKFHCALDAGTIAGEPQTLYGGVSYPAGSISSYAFTAGLLKLCLSRGLNLQTNTPATSLMKNRDERTWTVRTPRGNIWTKDIILATNGYTAAIAPTFQGVIVPLRGQVTAQRPGSNLSEKGCLPTTYSFIYDKGYEYMIPRPKGSRNEGDLVIGGGLVRAKEEGLGEYGTTDDTTVNEEISTYLQNTLTRYFGGGGDGGGGDRNGKGDDHPDGRIKKEWTGIMGYSPDGFPMVGAVPGENGFWMSCSFQGHGMVLCWMCAKALVEMMEGRDNEKLRRWFPEAFKVGFERMRKRFQGRLHTSVAVAPGPAVGGESE
ncbi:FAD dependent oxidoreductase [Neurospora hispaniola]|uniref:FAD dependent oxidoreductase n=1 Tax=Neurospora hispaniola TaxID=588809 RepID=A0AAJ0I7W8_9PEZI|nr:FAD dependent oxidoreductase [Neurospora hispaniola]